MRTSEANEEAEGARAFHPIPQAVQVPLHQRAIAGRELVGAAAGDEREVFERRFGRVPHGDRRRVELQRQAGLRVRPNQHAMAVITIRSKNVSIETYLRLLL